METNTSANTADVGVCHRAGDESRVPGRSRFQTIVICLALLLEGMSSSSINVQVAAVRDTLGVGSVGLGLVASAFLIAYAGLLPMAGRLVDAWDRRRVFLVGVALFGLGSVLCAVSVHGGMLVTGRFVQGAGAALSAPAALALITYGLPQGATRNRAVAIYGAMGAAGFSLGLVLPGFVVDAFGWRAGFAVLLPVVLVVLAVAWRVPGGTTDARQRVDLVGAALLTAALMVAVYTIGGIATQRSLVTAGQGMLLLFLVLLLARRGGVAGFPSGIVLKPRVLAACVALAAVFAGAIASYYVLSLALQELHGRGALEVGLALLPNPVAFALLAGFGARLVTRFSAERVLAGGMVLIAASIAFLAVRGLDTHPLVGMLPAQVGIGAGLALSFPAASIWAVDAAPAEFRGTTASLLTTWQNVGGATGLALVTALGVVPTLAGATEAGPGLAVCSLVVVAGGALAWLITVLAGSPRDSRRGAHRVSRQGAHR